MRICLLTIVAALALPASASAQDARWTGFYLGANIGAGTAKANADFSVLGLPVLSASEKLSGAVFGLQGGYNQQFGGLVIGAELDAQATNQKASTTRICVALACGAVAITQTSDDRLAWFGTLRGRVGFAAGPFLVYGTAGGGFGEFKSTQTLTTVLGSITDTKTEQRLAWVYGGGIETAINRNWSVKAEYLFLDTGDITTTYGLAGIGLITQTSRMTERVVRAGINYRF